MPEDSAAAPVFVHVVPHPRQLAAFHAAGSSAPRSPPEGAAQRVQSAPLALPQSRQLQSRQGSQPYLNQHYLT